MTEMESSSIDVSLSTSDEQEYEEPQTRSNSIDVEQRAIDKSRDVDQRTAWDILQVSIGYLIYKVNPINIGIVRKELLQQNLIRGKHLFCQFIIHAHLSSPDTHVYATLVAVINPALPEIGELVLERCIMEFIGSYLNDDKTNCLAFVAFIGHLINHSVADEKLAVELFEFVFDYYERDSTIEIVILIWEICGKKISRFNKDILNETLDNMLSFSVNEHLDKTLRNKLETILELYDKGGFKFKQSYLVLADENQITHFLTLDIDKYTEPNTIDYHYDPEFELNEKMYKSLILKLQLHDNEEEIEFESVNDFNTQYDSEKKLINIMKHVSDIEIATNMLSLRKICLRKMIHLTMDCKILIQQFLKHGQGMDLCFMMLDCCCEHSTYNDNFGLLAKEFCKINNFFADMMEITFIHSCVTSYRFDAHKSENIAKFFAHLMSCGVISGNLLSMLDDESITPNRRYATICNTPFEDKLYNLILEKKKLNYTEDDL